MSVAVAIWDNGLRIGHASISTPNRYISFHPQSRNKAVGSLPTAGKLSCLDDDKREMTLEQVIKIDGLDEKAIDEFHDSLEASMPHYQLELYNCSTVSAKALLIGAHKWNILDTATFGAGSKMWHYGHTFSAEHRRDHVARTAEELTDRAWDGRMLIARGIASRFGLINLGSKAVTALAVMKEGFIWSPGDVKSLARDLGGT